MIMLHPVCRVAVMVAVGRPAPPLARVSLAEVCVRRDANGARPGRPATHASVQCACVLNLVLALFLMRPCGLEYAKYGRGAGCGAVDQYVALKSRNRIMFIALTTELHEQQDASKDAPLQTV